MTDADHRPTLEHFKRILAVLGPEPYELTLFVSGASDSSADAVANIREICDAHLTGRHQLSIVDLNQQPDLAAEHNVLATPTLVKEHPLPMRTLVGDMSNHGRILLALGLPAADAPAVNAAEATTNRLV
jgi:circadian clock protein KaiB